MSRIFLSLINYFPCYAPFKASVLQFTEVFMFTILHGVSCDLQMNVCFMVVLDRDLKFSSRFQLFIYANINKHSKVVEIGVAYYD